MKDMALFLSIGAWDDIIADGSLADFYEHATREQVIVEGFLGRLYGVSLYTDAFLYKHFNLTMGTEVFLIPIEKARYFTDEYQPLLTGGHDATGEEILRVLGDVTPLSRDSLAEALDSRARVFVPQKRAELEGYTRFATTQEALDYIRGELS
jgi:hypothetical protein